MKKLRQNVFPKKWMEISPIHFFQKRFEFFLKCVSLFFQDIFSILFFSRMDLQSLFLKFHMFVCKPWMFFTSKVITWKHFFVSEWRFLHSFFLGCRFLHFFSVAIFWVSPEKCRNLHSEWWFLHYFFRLNKLSIFFSAVIFPFSPEEWIFSTFFWLESSPFFCVQLWIFQFHEKKWRNLHSE